VRGIAAVLALLAPAACDNQTATATEPKPAGPHRVAGIEPDLWKCDVVATPDALAHVLGGPVHPLDSPIAPPHGLPRPCNYVVDVAPQEQWTFDVYCRDDYKQRADELFDQYRKDSDDLAARYDAAAKSGGLKNDAGIVAIAVERAADVAIGAKALDHHGRGLIFIDDDAPCYVRVVGLDPQKRLDLAKLLAANLTYANAPMTPRPAK
jgi:hypothetical protein